MGHRSQLPYTALSRAGRRRIGWGYASCRLLDWPTSCLAKGDRRRSRAKGGRGAARRASPCTNRKTEPRQAEASISRDRRLFPDDAQAPEDAEMAGVGGGHDEHRAEREVHVSQRKRHWV